MLLGNEAQRSYAPASFSTNARDIRVPMVCGKVLASLPALRRQAPLLPVDDFVDHMRTLSARLTRKHGEAITRWGPRIAHFLLVTKISLSVDPASSVGTYPVKQNGGIAYPFA